MNTHIYIFKCMPNTPPPPMARRLMSLCVAGVSTCSNPQRRAHGSAHACDYTQRQKAHSCVHLAESSPCCQKDLIKSRVFADILLSHADRHTQINVCIKYPLTCLFWQEDSRQTHTHTHVRSRARTSIPGQQLALLPQSCCSHLA